MSWIERLASRRAPRAPSVAVVSVALALLLPSCRETSREQYERRLRETEKSMQHAVHSDRLLELMAQLKHLTYSRLPSELELSANQDQRFAEIRWIAQGMSSAARYIPEILNDVEMSGEREQEFRTLATRLHRECLKLERMATEKTASPSDLVTEFSLILDTCDTCHTRFRVLPRVRSD